MNSTAGVYFHGDDTELYGGRCRQFFASLSFFFHGEYRGILRTESGFLKSIFGDVL